MTRSSILVFELLEIFETTLNTQAHDALIPFHQNRLCVSERH